MSARSAALILALFLFVGVWGRLHAEQERARVMAVRLEQLEADAGELRQIADELADSAEQFDAADWRDIVPTVQDRARQLRYKAEQLAYDTSDAAADAARH